MPTSLADELEGEAPEGAPGRAPSQPAQAQPSPPPPQPAGSMRPVVAPQVAPPHTVPNPGPARPATSSAPPAGQTKKFPFAVVAAVAVVVAGVLGGLFAAGVIKV